ncbi:MAG: enoyl-CoA hydratase/carnithine racemase [Phenylobacterium sp.]|jgi:enoyl-CoA hydratase/carnithine racemase
MSTSATISPDTSHVLSQVTNKVLAITFNRPDKKHALTLQMYRQLATLLIDAGGNDEISVVTITGGQDCFSAGNDLRDFLSAGLLDDAHPVVQFLQVIAAFEKPIIAGVSGYAVGIGTTLLMHCDLVYATDAAKFRLPFVPLGLCPEGGSSLILPGMMGHQKAAELLMFGEFFSPATALGCGLINDIINDQPIEQYIAGRAEQLSQLPTESVLETKRLLKHNHTQVIETIDEEIIAFSRLMHSDECQAIIKKVLG